MARESIDELASQVRGTFTLVGEKKGKKRMKGKTRKSAEISEGLIQCGRILITGRPPAIVPLDSRAKESHLLWTWLLNLVA